MMFSWTSQAFARAALCAISLFFGVCAASSEPSFPAITLKLAHINDHHSQLQPFANQEIRLNGVATQADVGGFARLTTLFKQAQAESPELLKIHAGDAITGSLYYPF